METEVGPLLRDFVLFMDYITMNFTTIQIAWGVGITIAVIHIFFKLIFWILTVCSRIVCRFDTKDFDKFHVHEQNKRLH